MGRLGERPAGLEIFAGTVELSQLAKSAMKSNNAPREDAEQIAADFVGIEAGFLTNAAHRCFDSSDDVARSFMSPSALRAKAMMNSAALSRNACGQFSSAGSGHSAAQITARHAANGRRAHQICSVEICPCRIDFSRRACAEIRLMGRSTSMRRLG